MNRNVAYTSNNNRIFMRGINETDAQLAMRMKSDTLMELLHKLEIKSARRTGMNFYSTGLSITGPTPPAGVSFTLTTNTDTVTITSDGTNWYEV